MASITLNAAAAPGTCDYLSNQQAWTQDPGLFGDLTVKIGELFSSKAAEYFGKQTVDPLQAAVLHGDKTCMASLIAQTVETNYPQRPNLDQKIPGVGNLLHAAIYFNQYSALETLLSEYGIYLNSFRPDADGIKKHLPLIEEMNDQGETPMMLAARLGNTRAINFLHQYEDTLLEQKNRNGQRALHYAVQAEQTGSIELLNYYGVNLNARDANGNSPIDYLDEVFGKNDPLTQRIRQYDTERQQADDDAPMRINLLSHSPENLVFQGGGPKGIAYLGALNVLEENGLLGELKRVGGTSAGAIQASLLAVGYQSEEMIEVFNTIDPREFLDHPLARIYTRDSTEEHLKQASKELLKGVTQAYRDLPPGITGTIQGLMQLYVVAGKAKKAIQLALLARNLYKSDPSTKDLLEAAERANEIAGEDLKEAAKAMWNRTGLCEGIVFRDWLDEKIAERAAVALGKSKEDMRYLTLGELRTHFIDKGIPGFRHLHLIATDIVSKQPIAITSEDPKWDRVIISDAVRASMSIPGFFKPHTLHLLAKNTVGHFDGEIRQEARQEDTSLGTFVDGGLIANYPIDLFDYKMYLTTARKGSGIDSAINPRTLGLSNYDADGLMKEGVVPGNVGEMLLAIKDIYYNAEAYHLSKRHENKLRTIPIDNLGVGLADFGTDPLPLLHSGESAALQAIKASTSKLNEDYRYALEASGIKLPQVYTSGLRQYAENFEVLQHILFESSEDRPSQKAIIWGEGSEKVDLALSYKNRFSNEFSRALWITPDNILAVYKALAASLQIKVGQHAGLDTIRPQVHAALEAHPEKKPYLLIFDGFKNEPPLPEGKNGRFIILSEKGPSKNDEAYAIHPPFLEPEEKEYLKKIYFREIFARLHNPNCETPDCWNLDKRYIHPKEQEAIDAINSNRWRSTFFEEDQELLRLRKDDPRKKSLFLSTPHSMTGRSLAPKEYTKELQELNKKTDLKYKVVKSYKEICHEIRKASEIGEIAQINIQASRDALVNAAEIHGQLIHDKNALFAECYADANSEKVFPYFIS